MGGLAKWEKLPEVVSTIFDWKINPQGRGQAKLRQVLHFEQLRTSDCMERAWGPGPLMPSKELFGPIKGFWKGPALSPKGFY
jgi:hypothetical protein